MGNDGVDLADWNAFEMEYHQQQQIIPGGHNAPENAQRGVPNRADLNASNGSNLNNGQKQMQHSDMAQLMVGMMQLMNQNVHLIQTAVQNNNVQNNETQNFQFSVLPDLTHNIAEFNDLESAASARIWLTQLESTETFHHWKHAVIRNRP